MLFMSRFPHNALYVGAWFIWNKELVPSILWCLLLKLHCCSSNSTSFLQLVECCTTLINFAIHFLCTPCCLFLLCHQHPLVLVASRSADYQEITRTFRAQDFKDPAHTSKKSLKSTSESPGPSRSSNSSTATFRLSLSSRCRSILATTTLSRVLHLHLQLHSLN